MEKFPKQDKENKSFETKKEELELFQSFELILNEQFEEMYQKLTKNKYVLKRELKPSPEQFREFLLSLRSGVEYALDKYGQVSVPEHFYIAGGELISNGVKTDSYVCYHPEKDALIVSFLYIATYASLFGTSNMGIPDNRLPLGFAVLPEDFVFLLGVEEAYHCYQVKVLKVSVGEGSAVNREHKAEEVIAPIFDLAIKDKGIVLHEIVK